MALDYKQDSLSDRIGMIMHGICVPDVSSGHRPAKGGKEGIQKKLN
jgi:hypothetical protein